MRTFVDNARQWFGMWAIILGTSGTIAREDPKTASALLLITGFLIAPFRRLAIVVCIGWFALRCFYLFPRFRDWRFLAAAVVASVVVFLILRILVDGLTEEVKEAKIVDERRNISFSQLSAVVIGTLTCLFFYLLLVNLLLRYPLI